MRHYLGIAKDGYTSVGDERLRLVFFPLYPAVTRVFSVFTGGRLFMAGTLVSLLASGVCAALGVDFSSNDATIRKINNITNYNYMMPGKVILIPTKTVPGSGSYYKIMAHKLVAGDTVYGLCLTYGLSYENNITFLQRLNNRDNLATYYVGQTLYMPLYVAG